MPTSFLLELDYLCCGECGVVYCAPVELVRLKGEDGLYCPNGHETVYRAKDDDAPAETAKVTELRRELVHAIHRAEQAEAKAIESNGPKPARARRGKQQPPSEAA